jgi:protein gp37
MTDDFVKQVFEVMVDTPRHTHQVLTKRPIRLARMADKMPWSANAWMGVSVEESDQAWRVDRLREVPAAVRFVQPSHCWVL